jgi:hypothetical protein
VKSFIKRFWPLIPILLGILTLLFGFAWQVAFAGIPYPDPTPELAARYTLNTGIAHILYGIGELLCGGGVLALMFTLFISRLHKPTGK